MEDLEDLKTNLHEDVCCLALFITAHRSQGHINVSSDQTELQTTEDAQSVTVIQASGDGL